MEPAKTHRFRRSSQAALQSDFCSSYIARMAEDMSTLVLICDEPHLSPSPVFSRISPVVLFPLLLLLALESPSLQLI
ncbi:unnamed protein product [Cuscuta epithymum]|uniref:Uncharacterized protein n=1 Tax=Cuscuta epithymum TaxID=186058 RepID=A0AAV0EQK1_9ASTE|nr:unnamed protein product [Cuscuta epithymum]